MSTSTYLELCQETRRVCAITGSGPSSVTGQTGILQKLVYWVADADVAIQRTWINWDFLYRTDFSVATVAGSAEYIKPLDLGAWDKTSVFLNRGTSTNQQLFEIEYRRYFSQMANGVISQTKPGNFILPPSKNLILYPTPNAVYTLTANYWRTPVRMVNNADTSLIPESYIRAIIARAKMYYAIEEEATEVYNEALSEFIQTMNQLQADQLPGWQGYNTSDDVQLVVSTGEFGPGRY
jgi:hypothetical protein